MKEPIADSCVLACRRPCLAEIPDRLALTVKDIFREARLFVFALNDRSGPSPFDDLVQFAFERNRFRFPRLGVFGPQINHIITNIRPA